MQFHIAGFAIRLLERGTAGMERMEERHPNHVKKLSEIGRNIALIGQLGVSLVVPVLFCMLVCYYLNTHVHVGGWVYIPGLILGIGSSCMTAWKLYVSEKDKSKKAKDQDHGPSFSRHY